jgi:tetratricopeptide (TPR) repeat protein
MTELNLQIYEGYLNWAEDYYGRILTSDPRHAQALQGYADACRANLEHVRALELYTRAIAVNPREASLHLGRAKSHLALNDPEKAKADFQQVVVITDKLHLKRQAEVSLAKIA